MEGTDVEGGNRNIDVRDGGEARPQEAVQNRGTGRGNMCLWKELGVLFRATRNSELKTDSRRLV